MRKPKSLVSDVEVDEVSLVDKGDNPGAQFVLAKRAELDKAETKTVDGVALPAGAFAYVPDSEKPSTWKLPLFTSAASVPDSPDAARVGAAAAALGPRGYRGRKLDIPASDRPQVIRRVRAAWLRAHPDKGSDDLPEILKKDETAGSERAGLYQAAMSALESMFGKVSAPLRKRLYADVRADQAKEDAASAMRKRIDALSQAVYSAIYFPESEDSADEIRKSVAQFAEEISEDAQQIVAGRIAKAFEPQDAPPTEEEFSKEFASRFDELVKDLEQPGAGGPDTKEGGMDTKIDLSKKLSDDDRAVVEKALEAAKEVEGLKAKVAELEKSKDPEKKEPTNDDLYKGVPENIVKLIETRDAAHKAELEKRDKVIDKLTKDAEREAFEKTLDLPNIPAKSSELAKVLFALPQEQRDGVVKLLKATDEQLKQSAEIMKVIGADGAEDNERTVTAKSKMDAAIAEIRKADPKLTKEQAYTEALDRHPELFADLHASLN